MVDVGVEEFIVEFLAEEVVFRVVVFLSPFVVEVFEYFLVVL